MSALKDALHVLSSTDLFQVGEIGETALPLDNILGWLYVKYGHKTIDSLRNFTSTSDIIFSPTQWLRSTYGSTTVPELTQEEVEKIYCLVQPPPGGDTTPLLVLGPPLSSCYDCGNNLVANHSTTVKVYNLTGFSKATKVTLCCKSCKLSYNYANFGNKRELGFRLYPNRRKYVEASDTVYFERSVLNLQCSLA